MTFGDYILIGLLLALFTSVFGGIFYCAGKADERYHAQTLACIKSGRTAIRVEGGVLCLRVAP